jgi:hypothetical protein
MLSNLDNLEIVFVISCAADFSSEMIEIFISDGEDNERWFLYQAEAQKGATEQINEYFGDIRFLS